MKQILIIAVAVFGINAHAKYAGAQANQIPTASIFPTVNAILFPAVVTAAGVNASALGLYGIRTDLQMAYTKGSSSDPTGMFAGAELGSSSFGVGLGYIGQKYDGLTVNNMYGGFGVKAKSVSLGAAARIIDAKNGPGPALDLSLMSGGPSGLNVGFVAYNVVKKSQIDLGIGFGGARKYNFEINALLPPLMNGEGEGFTFLGSATLFGVEWLGLSARASYSTSSSSSGFGYMAGATVWFVETFNIFLFYTSPQAITGGLSFSF